MKTILLVEDEALIALAEARMLERHGYRVITAHSARQAIEMTAREDLDLILMDIDLGAGRMDGTEAAAAILVEREIPVVFLSSHTEPEVVAKTEGITSYGYIVKNSGETVLLASIKMAFRLFEAKTMYQDTFSYSINGICIHRMLYDEGGTARDCEYIRVNNAFTKHTGLSADRVIGRTIRDIYPENEADEVISLYAEVVTSGLAREEEIYFEPDNQWYELSVFPMEGDTFSVVIHRITERKHFEETLQASEEKHRRLFETMSQGVVYQGADGDILDANPTAERMLGMTLDQMKGRKSTDSRWKMITEEGVEVPGAEHPAMEALKTGKTIGPIIRGVFVPEREAYIWLRIVATPLFHPGEDKAYQVYATFDDITGQRQAEKVLQESEERYRFLVENLQEGVGLVDPDERILFVNPAFCRIFGYSEDKLLYRNLREFLPEDAFQDVREETEKRKQGQFSDYEIPIIHGSGERRYIRVHAAPHITKEGDFFATLGLVEDITHRRQIEQELHRQLSEKEILLKEIHHRVKNNIASIGSLLALQAGASTDDEVKAALRLANTRVQSMRILYEKLLSDQDYREISARDYIEDLLSSLGEVFAESGKIRLESRVSDITMSSKKLIPVGIIINELYTNTVKYAFRDRENGRVSLTLERTGNRITLVMEDDGSGLPEDFNEETNDGFGLMLVKLLSEQLEGSFTMERGGGTRCVLVFDD